MQFFVLITRKKMKLFPFRCNISEGLFLILEYVCVNNEACNIMQMKEMSKFVLYRLNKNETNMAHLQYILKTIDFISVL
jgi:hypothetical protein